MDDFAKLAPIIQSSILLVIVFLYVYSMHMFQTMHKQALDAIINQAAKTHELAGEVKNSAEATKTLLNQISETNRNVSSDLNKKAEKTAELAVEIKNLIVSVERMNDSFIKELVHGSHSHSNMYDSGSYRTTRSNKADV